MASHQSLYRAYRPSTFKEVVGQEQITNALAEQIASKKVAHAYLFAGSRGLGKTSIARIFARELGTSERDLYEIDAASNNSVDDIRSLTENVYTLPFESPYKVYILDEAHMLSKGAWNAFLKTLEEPPAYVIFILATTELSKVPETVQSRCQVYEFKKPSRAAIATLVTRVAKSEGYTLDAGAANLIAILADSSYRDALSQLEKILSNLEDKKVSREIVERAGSFPTYEYVRGLAIALSEGNADASLKIIREVEKNGTDIGVYLSIMLDYIRTILLVRHAPELRKEFKEENDEETYKDIEELAQAKESKLTHQTLKALLDATERMRFSPIPSLPLELVVLELFST